MTSFHLSHLQVAARIGLYTEALELVPHEFEYYLARASAQLEAGSPQQASRAVLGGAIPAQHC